MKTQSVQSPDGIRIAYDISGEGPALFLLHGGGQNRRHFHEAGYIQRLRRAFTVIAIDIRGNGESDKPIDQAAYTTDKHCQDILAVADACAVERFALCGFSYGGNIGRYLAAQSDRLAKFVMIGIPFGDAAQGGFRKFIEDLQTLWPPILQAQTAGTLDLTTLDDEDQRHLREGQVPVTLAWLGAMLSWRPIEPADMRCPTLWLVGSKNESAMASVADYRDHLAHTKVKLAILDGLNHSQEFLDIEQTLPILLNFTTKGGD